MDESLDFRGTEWITEQAFLDPPAGERRLLDLVAKVPVTVSAEGTPGEFLLLLHIEVESDDSTTRLRNQMLQYYAFLRRKYELPVLPIGLFLYVGHDGIGREVYEEIVWGHTLMRFEFFRIGLPASTAPSTSPGRTCSAPPSRL